MLIKRIYIHLEGDKPVGIGDSDAIVEADGDFLVDMAAMGEDQGDWLSEVRVSLADAFEVMWGERPDVTFDFEIAKQN